MTMNRKILILVFLLFAAPVVVAILLNSQWIDWQPGSTRNHGELIQPVVPIPEFTDSHGSAATIERSDLLDRWQLIHLRDSACDDDCLRDLYWLRQVRRAQDRHQPDIGLVLISKPEVNAEIRAQIAQLADDFVIIDGATAASLTQTFPGHENMPLHYIADPMTNIILRYPGEADPNGIRKDLRRLLTWTQRD